MEHLFFLFRRCPRSGSSTAFHLIKKKELVSVQDAYKYLK